MKNKAIILAAGRGSRMGALTAEQPKCLNRFGDLPLLAWQIWALESVGFQKQDITIVTGYKKELLEQFQYPTITNALWSETNMVSSLRCADEILSQHQTIVCYSDIAFHPEIITSTLQALPKSSLLIPYNRDWQQQWSDRFGDPLIDSETFERNGDQLVSIGNKPKLLSEVQGQYMGVLRFQPEAWSFSKKLLDQLSVDEQKKIHLTGLLNLLLKNKFSISCVPAPGKWLEIDSEADLNVFQGQLEKNTEWFSKELPHVQKTWDRMNKR
jgi:L-glutamine-phosphate cytidylyltransferase